ncbi:hypothetical protein LZ32DRAFT_544351, partial [Colletotrichum eremochloae]
LKSIIITLVTAVKVTKGCGVYTDCRCTMADGSINNTITADACRAWDKSVHPNSDTAIFAAPVDHDNIAWCTKVGESLLHAIDNCEFRKLCTAAGATGHDSWCRGK